MKTILLVAAAVPLLGGDIQFNWKEHPTVELGKAGRLNFRYKLQSDFRGFGDVETDEGLHEFHRERIGIEGKLFKRLEFEIEREMRDPETPWRDAWVNLKLNRAVEVKAGKFKLPFSMDQLTSPTKGDFIFRSRGAAWLAPGRDIGVMAHGRLIGKTLRYEAGVFREDGDNARGGGVTLAGRLRGQWRDLQAGFSLTQSDLEEGLNGLRGKAISGHTFFPRINVNGSRLRLGVEGKWTAGPVTVKSELIQVRDQRLAQSLNGADLPDLISRGWYVSGIWRLGRFDIAARHDALSFSSAGGIGRPSRSPRAANILGNRDNIWTFGATWRINRFLELQPNFVHESFSDPARSPIPGRAGFSSRLLRLQFGL